VNEAGRPLVFHVLVVAGLVVVIAIAVVLRRLQRAVALEDAERVLRAEIDRCEQEER
jgi:hypothetical protein